MEHRTIEEYKEDVFDLLDDKTKLEWMYQMSEQLCNIAEYINFLSITTDGIKEELLDKCKLGFVKFNETIWGEELLELLGENDER